MEVLKNLILNLGKNEVLAVKEHYKHRPNYHLRYKLFKLVLDGKVTTDQQACRALYGKSAISPAYSMLKSRLLDDLLELFYQFNEDELSKAEYTNKLFRCRKLLATGELLSGRGAKPAAAHYLQEAADIATEYEFQAEALAAKNALRNIQGQKEGADAYHKFKAEMDQHKTSFLGQLEAEELYHEFGLCFLFETNKESMFTNYFDNALPKLQAIYESTGSSFVKFHLINLEYYKNELEHDYEAAKKKAMEMLKLVEDNKAIKSKARIAIAKVKAATMLLYLRKYQECIDLIMKARVNYRPNMMNYLSATETALLSAINNKDFELAKSFLNEGFAHPLVAENSLHKDNWVFYHANLEYLQGNKEKALGLLAQIENMHHDKDGWNLGVKFLELYIYYDLNDKGFDNKLLNLQKFLKEFPEQNTDRAKIMVNLLHALRNNKKGFTKKNFVDYALLVSDKGSYMWNPMGFEVIPFHEWLKGRVVNMDAEYVVPQHTLPSLQTTDIKG